ncbi:MAG: ABC transporter permease, partial [Streptomyces sp.]|nr:ABC transporter permease [Streptomyces sp.]
MFFDSDLLMSALRALTPILLAALGGALCERAGVFNIGLEGMMLMGCFTAVATSWFTGSPWLGVLAAA